MKKQYCYYETTSFLYNIELYNDGVYDCTHRVWLDELDTELDFLESEGYTRGFTKSEVGETNTYRFKPFSRDLIGKR